MEDAKMLARIGAIAKLAGAPWLSVAESSVVGCPSFGTARDPDGWTAPEDDGWEAIRRLPYAGSLGLAMPRFLLRLPYGRDTDECERLAFEEMVGADPGHESYLWGNPALLCVLLLLQEVAAHGWEIRPGRNLEVRGLPLHIHKRDGEVVAQPCAEALLTERALTRISDRGLMAFASLKDRDAVRLLRFQSISNPPTSLDGPWV
jgi:type VI secretion system protein ImpC